MAARELTGLVYASKVLTFADVSVATQTVVIGNVTYTFRASVTTTANEVKVGADAAISATNLALAINAGPTGSGTLWGSLTVDNPYVVAIDNGDATVTVVAAVGGTIGNAIPIAETGTNTSWAGGATFLSGGVTDMGTTIYSKLLDIRTNQQVNAQTSGMLDRLLYDLNNGPSLIT